MLQSLYEFILRVFIKKNNLLFDRYKNNMLERLVNELIDN